MNALLGSVHYNQSGASFFGQVNAEASAASPSTQEEGTHNDVQHYAPQALQPAGADINTLDTWTNHPVMDSRRYAVIQL